MTGEHVCIYYLWDWIIQDQSGTMHHMLTNLVYVFACTHHCLWPNGIRNRFNRGLFCAEHHNNHERRAHAVLDVYFLRFFNHPVHLPLGLLAYLLSFQLNQTITRRSRDEDVGSGPPIKTGPVIRFHFRWFGWALFPFSLSVFFLPPLSSVSSMTCL